jgi:uncharacterized protein
MQVKTKIPIVWVLLGQKSGDNAQLRNLARLIEWPYEEKQLCFNEFSRYPNILLGPTLVSIKSDPSLVPPWPDLLISAGKRSVPAARWVKRRSGGHTKLVHVGRPWAPLDWFDLIVSTPQYRLPSRPNVIHNTMPIIRHDLQLLLDEAEKWSEAFRALPRPWIAFLAGGPSRPFTFNQQTAKALGRAVSSFAREHGGSLLVTASRRCPPKSFQALAEEIDCDCHIHNPHDLSQRNPYFAYLHLADRFIVTIDSASMIAEACLMHKPVCIIDLPVAYDRKMRRAVFLRSFLRKWQSPACDRLYESLVDYGLITSTRDMQFYADNLRHKGLVSLLGERGELQSPEFSNDEELEHTRSRIRGLLE